MTIGEYRQKCSALLDVASSPTSLVGFDQSHPDK
jgi:hypothetical protein